MKIQNEPCLYSQNVQELRNEMKEGYIVRIMEAQKLVPSINQKTHLPEDYIKILGDKNCYMIHHGSEQQPK